MTYGEEHGEAEYDDKEVTPGTRPFFNRVDEKFFSWNEPLHNQRPFDRIFPYDHYGPNNRVLEIGCGLGTMSMLWAKNNTRVVSIDLNPTSVSLTKKRFELNGKTPRVSVMDANELAFPENSFDYVYSWGVLHHSPNLDRSIREMMRVLKSGESFGLMLYNRRSIFHQYTTRYLEGFLHYESNFLNPLELASRYSDDSRKEGNPYTWPVTQEEIKEKMKPYCDDLSIQKFGTELDSTFKWLLPGLGLILPDWLKKPWARRWGWSLWISGTRSQ